MLLFGWRAASGGKDTIRTEMYLDNVIRLASREDLGKTSGGLAFAASEVKQQYFSSRDL